MPCYQSTNLPGGVTTTGRTSYKTEADCLNACKEGACCEGATCTVKPQCQCQGTGRVFKGVGTVCTPNPCLCCTNGTTNPQNLSVEVTSVDYVPGATYSLAFSLVGTFIVPFSGCPGYADNFFPNSSGCYTPAYNCFTPCSHKLRIEVQTEPVFRVTFSVCDSSALLNGSAASLGGQVWKQDSALPLPICNNSLPITGITNQRNNPNNGGILNAISYRITAA
jgi:hypothetical protein